MAKETVPNRRYTDEFKLEALWLAESVGINHAAKRPGMPNSSLGNWARLKRSSKLGKLPRAGPMSERMQAKLVCGALTMAYPHRKPPPGLDMHSDRGVRYAGANTES